MLDATQKQQVKNVMGSLFVLGEMFSKFDVTSIMRNEGQQKVAHWAVRDECDSLIGGGIMPPDYQISHVRLKKSGATAQVLHPNWKNPHTDYDEDALTKGTSGIDPNADPTAQNSAGGGTATIAPPAPVATATATTPTAVAPPPPTTAPVTVTYAKPAPRSHAGNVWTLGGTDKQGRLCVPNTLVRQLSQTGVPAGGKVFLKLESGSVTIAPTPTMFGAGAKIKSYVVDKDQNIRLSAGVLKEVGLNSAAGFKVTGDQVTIKVEAV